MTQRFRLMNPLGKGDWLVEFSTSTTQAKQVAAEALALIHPWFSQLTYMESQLQVWENGAWDWYI